MEGLFYPKKAGPPRRFVGRVGLTRGGGPTAIEVIRTHTVDNLSPFTPLVITRGGGSDASRSRDMESSKPQPNPNIENNIEIKTETNIEINIQSSSTTSSKWKSKSTSKPTSRSKPR